MYLLRLPPCLKGASAFARFSKPGGAGKLQGCKGPLGGLWKVRLSDLPAGKCKYCEIIGQQLPKTTHLAP